MHPVMLVGLALFLVGMLTFLVVLFASGGSGKSEQFRVIGELFAGRHGPGRRAATIVALACVAAGALTSFAGVALGDRERARRCEAHCVGAGYLSGTIGPSSSRDPARPRAAAFVACRCEGGRAEPLEVRADDLQ